MIYRTFRNNLETREVIMKLNISNFCITHKSSTCFSKKGEPLSEYSTHEEADRSAAYVSETGTRMVAYHCSICGKYHIKPAEYYFNKSEHGCSCTDHTGKSKCLYADRAEAERMVLLRGKSGIKLYIYKCPNTNGYHLTSSLGY